MKKTIFDLYMEEIRKRAEDYFDQQQKEEDAEELAKLITARLEKSRE